MRVSAHSNVRCLSSQSIGPEDIASKEIARSLLSNLKIVQTLPKAIRMNGIANMRQKLIDRISDQIALARAGETGDSYQRPRFRRIRDLETGDVTEIPSKTRVRSWWGEDKDGSLLLWIKYGNRALELQKGKTAIRLESRSAIIPTLELICDAVGAGEFDAQITVAVDGFKTRFRKG